MKFVPVTVTIVSPVPAAAPLGLREVIAGAWTAKALVALDELLVFFTVMYADPDVFVWMLVTAAVSCVGPTQVVESAVEPHMTVDTATTWPEPLIVAGKFVPLTVSVKPPEPATADGGLKDAIVGPFTAKVVAVEVAPPGFTTVMPADSELAAWVLVMTAVSWVALK